MTNPDRLTPEHRADIVRTAERIIRRTFEAADENKRRLALGLPLLDINDEIDEAQADLSALRKRLTNSEGASS